VNLELIANRYTITVLFQYTGTNHKIVLVHWRKKSIFEAPKDTLASLCD